MAQGKLSSKALLNLQSGDNLYSRKLDAKAIIAGQKQANGHLHYVVEIQHGRAEPVEILCHRQDWPCRATRWFNPCLRLFYAQACTDFVFPSGSDH